MRPAAAFTAFCCALLLAGCGGSADGEESARDADPVGVSLEELWRAPGDDVAVVPGTSDFGPGENRVSFLVVDAESRVIDRPTAKVWVSRGLEEPPFAEAIATNERVGVPGGASGDSETIYVTRLDLPGPGRYWFLAEPVGGRKVQALGNLVVKRKPEAPDVGDRAVPSKTPTLRSTGGKLEVLTTSSRPDRALYRSSVAEAMAAKAPFVVSFATPLYCQSRTCGPVVDVVSAVRKRFAGTPVRFVNVEIYEGNDPANGVNRWVDEWNLPTEPYTFVVDSSGVIRSRLEGAFSARELEAAVRGVLP